MRAVVQRVSRARVTVSGATVGEIGEGLMILLSIGRDDSSAVAVSMANKIAHLRIFEDDQRKMNCSLLDVKDGTLVVSQFTLYGEARSTQAKLHRGSTARTGEAALRKIQRSAAQIRAHRNDKHLSGDDGGRPGQRG